MVRKCMRGNITVSWAYCNRAASRGRRFFHSQYTVPGQPVCDKQQEEAQWAGPWISG